MKNISDNFKVKKGLSLARLNTKSAPKLILSKEDALIRTAALSAELEKLQTVLYAEHKHKVLVILQGMDAAGKDGTIRHVFRVFDPQGVDVVSFKVPDAKERDHDFLWRVHQEAPAKGMVGIFNRSHYEDFLVPEVHGLLPGKTLQQRLRHINDFERMLADEGTTILKFFLHISKEEQNARLEKRLKDPEKKWKFNPGDLRERKLWDRYMRAYQQVMGKCNPTWAPWYVIPADCKWYRNYAISAVLVESLKKLNMKFPLKAV